MEKLKLKPAVFNIELDEHNLTTHICGGVSSQNCVLSPQNTHCTGLPTYGWLARFRVWNLTHLVCLSAGGLHSSVDLGGKEDVSVLREVYLGPKWICFTGWAGRWPLDRLSRECTYNQFLQVACHSWPFPCCIRGVNLLTFTLARQLLGRETALIAGREGGCYSTNLQAKYFLGFYLHLSLTSKILSSTGGANYIPSLEQAGRLTKFLNAQRSRATWIAN